MNPDRYTFTLHIDHPNFGGRTCAVIQADVLANREILRAVDHVEDPMTALMVGAPAPRTMAEIKARREQLAKDLSAALTEQILKAFESKDTRNGYPIPR